MKTTKFKQFIQSYFYTIKKEQQGTYLLLFLFGLIGIANASIPLLVKPEPIQVQLVNLPPEIEHKTNPNTLVQKQKVQFQKLELNSADSVALEKLYKIGPKLAGKIVAYRKKLGGYHKLYQLVEIYGFQEDFLYDLQEQVYINPNKIQKININTCALEQLQQHPYFKFSLSKQLVNFREQHGFFKEIQDLKNIKTVNDSIFQMIEPYVHIGEIKN
jgi:competence protein ComEA